MRHAALIVVLALLLCIPARAQELECLECIGISSLHCAPAVLDQVVIKEETAGYEIDIKYPVLCSAKATQVIRDHVTRSLSEFKMDFPEHDLTDYRHKHQMMTDYSAWTAGNGRFVSVKLLVMVYTGGAHPNNWPETWTFDLANDSRVTLSDIFSNQRDALIEIAPMVRETLGKSLGEMALPSMLEPGTMPVENNYDDFILNDEGIVFFFAPYQVAPYAAGEQVVTIPWATIIHLLKPNFSGKL